MRFRWLAVLPLLLISVLPVSMAHAKTVSDPSDLSWNIDFRSVSLTKPSSGKLSWTFTSWYRFSGNDMPSGSYPTLNLDTRSGKAVDYKVAIGWTPTDGYFCQLKKAGGGMLANGTATKPSGKSARCVFPSTKISRTKPIHWRASIKAGSIGRDVAPNSGWVVGI
jgi:hypothetical protein